LHPVLDLKLLLLQRDLLDLLLVAQDGLVGQLAQPAFVLVVLRFQLPVLVVGDGGRNRFLGHSRLLRVSGRPSRWDG
jgi:hypothetical protein